LKDIKVFINKNLIVVDIKEPDKLAIKKKFEEYLGIIKKMKICSNFGKSIKKTSVILNIYDK